MIMSAMKKDKAGKQKSPKHDIEDLDESPRQGNIDPSIGSKDNISADKTANTLSKRREIEENRNQDSRQELIAKASKSPAEEKEDERSKDTEVTVS